MEARLHAVLSRNMYSLQGLLALMRPPLAQVCQALIVESNCIPGSAQRHASNPMSSQWERALNVRAGLPSIRRNVFQSSSLSTAAKNSSGTRTELLEFCPLTVAYASPLK